MAAALVLQTAKKGLKSKLTTVYVEILTRSQAITGSRVFPKPTVALAKRKKKASAFYILP